MTEPTGYALVPWFVLRMAGFPIELVRALRLTETTAAVDALLEAVDRTTAAAARLAELADQKGAGKLARAARARRTVDAATAGDLEPLVREYAAALGREGELRAALEVEFEGSFTRSRARLWDIAKDARFREMLLLSGHEELASRRDEELLPRRKKLRQREQTLVAYLQRVTTKNETISFFGPTAWGRVDAAHPAAARVVLDEPHRLDRCVYVERWVCEALFERMASEPDVAALLSVDAADDLELVGRRAVLHGSGSAFDLSQSEVDVVRRSIDRPATPEPPDVVAGLVDRGLLVRRMPTSADPLGALRALVANWPAADARTRWSATLDALDRARAAIADAEDLDARRSALEQLAAVLRSAGVADRKESSALYAGRLPVNEDCRRAAREAVVGAPLVEQLTQDLAPWYELWRDIAGAYARGLLRALEPVWTATAQAGAPSLAAFLKAADAAGVPLGRTGGIGVPRDLESVIQRAWHEQLGARANEPEVVLEPDDMAFVRRRLDVRRMRAFDWPAPDVQLCTPDAAMLEQGHFSAVLAEIHPSFVLWAHCFFWSCPDPQAFADACRAGGIAPALEFAPIAVGRGTHMFRHASRWLGDFVFTGPLRLEGEAAIRSADITVHLEDDDLLARDRDGRRLGSLIDTWLVAASTHRLELLGLGAHAPRLRVGRVVVQRRSWLVDIDESTRRQLDGAFGPQQLELLRGLRRRHGLPEEVFVRPVLASRTAEHKDQKPLFVDFRSPLLVELLAMMARHYVRLRFTEALPTSDLHWPGDSSGHYSCELRLTTRPA